MKNQILVTGASGLIGENLTGRLLKLGIKPLILKRNDLSNSDQLKRKIEKSNIVVHLAGLNKGSIFKLTSANIFLTWKLLEAIRKFSANEYTIIFASSFAVYRPNSSTLISEQSITMPRNYYGLSKLICEKIIRAYCVVFGVRSTILRISNAYGPGSKINYSSVVANFINAAHKNEKIVINGGKQIRDFIYIDDVIEAILRILRVETETNEIFNICSSEGISIKELAQSIKVISKKEIEIVYGKKSSTDGKFVGSFKKSQRILGWVPKTALRDGIRITYKLWKVQ